MAGPMPGLLTLMEELYGRINKERLFGGGVRGAATRGLLGADAPENATPAEMEVYRNIANASMALAAGPVAATRAMRGAKTLKNAPQAQAMETARQNAVKMLGLPESNTAMDRARAMGFDTPGFRGSTVEEAIHKNPVWWSEDPGYASAYAAHTIRPPKGQPDKYAGNVMPLLVKQGKSKQFEKFNVGGVPIDPFLGFDEGVETGFRRYAKNEITGNMGGKIWEALTVPQNVRSRFAAFDPARIDEKDLLASLAAIGITLPLTMGLLSEQID